jgi:hypothetical protein
MGQLLDNIVDYTNAVGMRLIDKFTVEYLVNYFDRTSIDRI